MKEDRPVNQLKTSKHRKRHLFTIEDAAKKFKKLNTVRKQRSGWSKMEKSVDTPKERKPTKKRQKKKPAKSKGSKKKKVSKRKKAKRKVTSKRKASKK